MYTEHTYVGILICYRKHFYKKFVFIKTFLNVY